MEYDFFICDLEKKCLVYIFWNAAVFISLNVLWIEKVKYLLDC